MASDVRQAFSPTQNLQHARLSSGDDGCDHEISLTDSTLLANAPDSSLKHSSTNEPVERQTIGLRDRLRDERTKQKYKQYQEGRYREDEEQAAPSDEEAESSKSDTGPHQQTTAESVSRAYLSRIKGKIPYLTKKTKKAKKKEEFEIDILYENQRGSFFCGIPLYSSNGLLNFDPAAWQTREFRESPVNITNAELPDPTWRWAWKSWYVDMSHDVDEEGWEYSFSFRQGFSWHGTQPWFHSFVRRRRWLRKRVKIAPARVGKAGGVQEAHMLNPDYFTIHSAAREVSPGRESVGATTQEGNNRWSVLSKQTVESEDDADVEIRDVNKLMKALKKATVDRLKINVLRNFLEHGGAELAYLPDRMAEIMSLFVYQNSRQQVIQDIQRAAGQDVEVEDPPSDTDGMDEVNIHTHPSHRESLERAAEAAKASTTKFEFWSEQTAISQRTDPFDALEGDATRGSPVGSARPAPLRLDTSTSERDQRMEIKGIPESAKIGEEPSIARRAAREREEQEGSASARSPEGKGKEKAPF